MRILALLLLLTVSLASAQVARVTGEALWLPFEEGGESRVNPVLSGTLSNNPTSVAGVLGRALQFNGAQAVVIPHTNLLSSASKTISFWFRQRWADNSNLAVITAKGGGAFNWEYQVFWNNSNLVVQILQANGNVHAQASISATQIKDNRWNHVAYVVQSGTYIAGWINGSRATISETFTLTRGTSTAPLLIGRRSDGRHWHGTLDDDRYWNRALSDPEIASLYFSRRPGPQ